MSLAETFARTRFAQFINSGAGRVVRIIAGLGLLYWGFVLRTDAIGIVIMAVGLVPLLAGSLDLCLISPLLGGPLGGAAVRRAAANQPTSP